MKSKFADIFVKALVISALFPLTLLARAQNAEQGYTSQANGADGDVNFEILRKSKGDLIRMDRSIDWSAYKRFEVAPSSYEPIDKGSRLNAQEVQKLTSLLDAHLKALFPDQSMQEGALLRIEPLLTSVKRTDTVVNVVSFALVQMPLSYGAVSVRFELIDAQSGRVIGEVCSNRSARPWNVYPWNVLKNFQALGQSTVLLKGDARLLRKDVHLLTTREFSPHKDALASTATEPNQQCGAHGQ